MKSRRLKDMRELVASPEFTGWWETLASARAAHREAEERHEELTTHATLMELRAEASQKTAIDSLYRAGEAEDEAAKLTAERQTLENDSFKAVASYEEQRFRSSEVWFRQCASERRLETLRESLLHARTQAAAMAGHGKKDLEAKASHFEAELKRAERAHVQIVQEYEREESLKKRMWDEVERSWDRSMELNLQISEHQVGSRKVRAEAERLFQRAEDRKKRADALRHEMEAVTRDRDAAGQRAGAMLEEARQRFGCAPGIDFLFFRQREAPTHSWCVPLGADSQTYNIELKPLAVYAIDARRGVEFLEPAVERVPSDEEGDRRFEEYFLKGRKGRPPPSGEQRPA